jgi:hypothetical protein
MALSCSCSDFDKSELDKWWERDGREVPPDGARCCECNAPLEQVPCECFARYETYEPKGEPPPHPDDLPDEEFERLTKTEVWSMEALWDDWQSDHGWDADCERYERVTDVLYRCERCSDHASIYEDLGYCTIEPGKLIEANAEYISWTGAAPRKWVPDATGRLDPRPLTRPERLARRIKAIRPRVRWYCVYGWKRDLLWPFKARLRRFFGG